MKRLRGNILTACVTAALTCSGAVSANTELLKMQENPNDWVMPNGNYASTRYSALDQINASNVKDLRVAWTFSTGVLRGHEGGPLVIGDVMYVHTPFPNKVFALDLKNDGKIIWKYEPRQDPNVIPVMCCDTVNRGVAYGDGKIFLSQADTTLVALDAKTGKKIWEARNGDPTKGETSTAAPMVVKDKVYVGISGGEFGLLIPLAMAGTDQCQCQNDHYESATSEAIRGLLHDFLSLSIVLRSPLHICQDLSNSMWRNCWKELACRRYT